MTLNTAGRDYNLESPFKFLLSRRISASTISPRISLIRETKSEKRDLCVCLGRPAGAGMGDLILAEDFLPLPAEASCPLIWVVLGIVKVILLSRTLLGPVYAGTAGHPNRKKTDAFMFFPRRGYPGSIGGCGLKGGRGERIAWKMA